jgi:uncharacterized membrane protein
MQGSKTKKDRDIYLTMLFSSLSIIAFSALPFGDVFRAILILPLILFLPGYAFICILFPLSSKNSFQDEEPVPTRSHGHIMSDRSNKPKIVETELGTKREPFRLEPYMRIGLAFILSVTFSSILQFLYNELYPLDEGVFGLRPEPTIITLYIIAMVSSIGALIIRAKKTDPENDQEFIKRINKQPSDIRSTILTLILLTILIISISFTFYRLYNDGDTGDIELYILGKGGEIDDYPDLLMADGIYSLVIGVHNPAHEEGNMTILITTSSSVPVNTLNVSDPQVFNDSTSVLKEVVFINDNRMEYRLNFIIRDPGKYMMTFFLINKDKVIRQTWLNMKVFKEGNIWTSDDNKVRTYLADENGSPFGGIQTVSSREPLFLRLWVNNKDYDIFRMNTTVYLEDQPIEHWSTFSLNYQLNLTIFMQPYILFNNQTIMEPNSKISALFGIVFPPGTWTLRIGVNEQNLGCVLWLIIISY